MTISATRSKRVLVLTVGDEPRRRLLVDLPPQARASDVLAAADLHDWRLVDRRQRAIPPHDRLFDVVEEGQTLLAVKGDPHFARA